MSEVLTVGVAAAAVAACAVVAGSAACLGRATKRALFWLSDQALQEMERLDRELAAPMPTHTTPIEARREFERLFARVKRQMAESPALQPYGDAAARVLALSHSPLAAFFGEANWATLHSLQSNRQSFNRILNQASRNFVHANANHVTRSIVEVGGNIGFTRRLPAKSSDGPQHIVLTDDSGRAVVARVTESESGAKVNINLTGFADGSCHSVMDQILAGLAEKDILLDRVCRHPHQKSGSIVVPISSHLCAKPKATQVSAVTRQKNAERRRRLHHAGARNTIKN